MSTAARAYGAHVDADRPSAAPGTASGKTTFARSSRADQTIYRTEMPLPQSMKRGDCETLWRTTSRYWAEILQKIIER